MPFDGYIKKYIQFIFILFYNNWIDLKTAKNAYERNVHLLRLEIKEGGGKREEGVGSIYGRNYEF